MADDLSDPTEEAVRRLSDLLITLDRNLQQIKVALVHITEMIDEESEDEPGH